MVPVFVTFLKTGLVPHFPTLIVSGFIFLTAIISFFSGVILDVQVEKGRQDFEYRLQEVNFQKKMAGKLNEKIN